MVEARDNYQPCGAFWGYRLLVRKGLNPPRLVDCARLILSDEQRPSIELDLTPVPGRVVEQFSLVDLDENRILADTRPATGSGRLSLIANANEAAHDRLSDHARIDLSAPRQISLAISAMSPPPSHHALVVRLHDGEDRVIETLPVLEETP
jgi:hypothetical protein